jgi:hypothetical protein
MARLRYLLASLLGVVNCVSLDTLGTRGKFSIQQVGVNKTSKSIFHEMRRTYWKYGWETPQHIEDGVERVERMLVAQQGMNRVAQVDAPQVTGSVVAQSVKGDLEYLITVQVGQHNLMLDLDTGSSDL